MTRISSYDVYIDDDRAQEFLELMHERFGDAIEWNFRDTEDY